MDDVQRFNISGFTDLIDGEDEGDDSDLWSKLGYASAAAMSVANLLDDDDGAPMDKDDELTLAMCQLQRPQAEQVVVALARWEMTRAPFGAELASLPTLGELRQQIVVLGSLDEPLAAHDAAALRLLLGKLDAL